MSSSEKLIDLGSHALIINLENFKLTNVDGIHKGGLKKTLRTNTLAIIINNSGYYIVDTRKHKQEVTIEDKDLLIRIHTNKQGTQISLHKYIKVGNKFRQFDLQAPDDLEQVTNDILQNELYDKAS